MRAGADAARRRSRPRPAAVRSVRFFDGRKLIATEKQGGAGIFSAAWRRGASGEGQAHAARDRHRCEGPQGRSTARRARLQVGRPREGGRGHRCVQRDRRRDREGAGAARLALRAGRPPAGAAASPGRRARRRVRALRRLRPRGRRPGGRGDPDAPPDASTCSSTTPASPGAANFLALEPERIEAVLQTNYLGGVWLRARARARGCSAGSHVVNVVSVAGVVAFAPAGPYAASKHAQLAFSRSLAGLLRGARRAGAHRPPRLRRDGGLPAEERAHERVLPPGRDRPGARRRAHRQGGRVRASASSSCRAGTGSSRSCRRSCRGCRRASSPARATAAPANGSSRTAARRRAARRSSPAPPPRRRMRSRPRRSG